MQCRDRRAKQPSSWARARLACLAVLLASVACAGSVPDASPLQLRWPAAPEPSRIISLELYEGFQVPEPSFWRSVGSILGLSSTPPGRSLVHPADVAVSPDGAVVYVSDFAQGIVHVIDRRLKKTRYFGDREPLARPYGLALDSSGNLYVVEQQTRQVRLLDPAGRTLRVFRCEPMVRPVGVALDEERGRLYVADAARQSSLEHYVRVFDLDGTYLGEVGRGRGSGPGELLFPTYLAVGPGGNLYVADTMNARISVFDPAGQFVHAIGERGDGFGFFDKPKGMAFDSFGNLYVVDSSWSIVQIFGPENDVLLFFGGRGPYPGLLRNPTGIAIARDTNTIFVGDYLNRRLGIYQLSNTRPGDGVLREPTNGGGKP